MSTADRLLSCSLLVAAWMGVFMALLPARAQGQTALRLSGCPSGLESELQHLVDIENRSGAFGASRPRALVHVQCRADAAVLEASMDEQRLQRVIALDAEVASARALSLAIVELLHDLRFEIDSARAAAEQAAAEPRGPPAADDKVGETGATRASGAPAAGGKRSDGRLLVGVGISAALNDARSVRWSPALALDFLARPWLNAGIACQVSLPHTHQQQGITTGAFWTDATVTLGASLWRGERAAFRVQAGLGAELLSARAEAAPGFRASGRQTQAAMLATLEARVLVWLDRRFGFGVHAGAQAPSRSLDYGIVFEGRRVTFVDPWPVSPYLRLSVMLRGLP